MRDLLKSSRGFAHILLIIILLLGLLAGLYLVQRTQIFKPRAYNKPDVDPVLYDQRIAELRTKFKISEDVPNEEVQDVVKDELLKTAISIEGDIVASEAQTGVSADCLEDQQTNFAFSEYGVFPPLCIDEEQQKKMLEYSLSGAETAVDFIVEYSQAKQATVDALNLGEDMAQVRKLEEQSGVADRVRDKLDENMVKAIILSGGDVPISVTSIGDGYAPTLVRIKELERDVQQNPDGTGNLTFEQEQARREYLYALKTLWEKQHNVLFGLSSAVALSLIDRPLKIVGAIVEPVTGPFVAKIGTTYSVAKGAVLKFLDEATIRRTILGELAKKNSMLIKPDNSTIALLCAKYMSVLDDFISFQSSREFAVTREELLDIAANGRLSGQSIEYRVPGRHNYETFLGKRSRLISFYQVNPMLAKSLIRHQIIGIHGSSSGTLISVLDNGLVPLLVLREKGELIPVGERVFANNAVQNTTSFFQWYDLNRIQNYLGSRSPITVMSLRNDIKELEQLLETDGGIYADNTRRAIADLEKVIEFLEQTPSDRKAELKKQLIEMNFPIAFGINGSGIDESRMFAIQGLNNEFVVKEGVQRSNIRILFVPKDKIEFIKENIDTTDLEILPLDDLVTQAK